MISCSPVHGLGEVCHGDDLVDLLLAGTDLHDGDVLVVTSKVVSKAEGRVVTTSKEEALAEETDRVVARRGTTAIVRTHHGLVMAAGGIDASNTEPGTLVLLPVDPDRSARSVRDEIDRRRRVNVAVLVSDTSGRAWRNGQTDIAVGAAGIEPLDDHAGRVDAYGNVLAVTAPALADEITAAADLATGKLSRSPAAVLRGLEHLVLPRGEHGPGAAALVRDEAHDMFGLGSREAVLASLVRDGARGFGAPAPVDDLVAALTSVVPESVTQVSPEGRAVAVSFADVTDQRRLGALEERAAAVAFSLAWFVLPSPGTSTGPLTLVPVTP